MIEISNECCISYLQDSVLKFDFIFADPPFNIGHRYDGFDDNIEAEKYQSWTTDWIINCWDSLSDGGAMVIHGSVNLRPIFWTSIIELGLAGNFENEIVWHYRFGQCKRSDFIDNHCPEIVLRKKGERKWYPDNVLVESDRSSKYKDKRTSDYKRGGSRTAGTVWGVPSDGTHWGRVQGTSKERWNHHPNQLPLNLVGRHLQAYTREEDLVLDPFCGSGTTALACLALNRSCFTFDISESNTKSARVRLKEQADLAKERLNHGRLPVEQ
jgi:site-specific DNA-methyltransferase (adenine-specific)